MPNNSMLFGDPGRIRTCDPQLRRLMLLRSCAAANRSARFATNLDMPKQRSSGTLLNKSHPRKQRYLRPRSSTGTEVFVGKVDEGCELAKQLNPEPPK
jgi:hypothetical protein